MCNKHINEYGDGRREYGSRAAAPGTDPPHSTLLRDVSSIDTISQLSHVDTLMIFIMWMRRI